MTIVEFNTTVRCYIRPNVHCGI